MSSTPNHARIKAARRLHKRGVGIADIAKQLRTSWAVARSYVDPDGSWRTFPTEKVCTMCGKTRSIDEYPRDNVQPDRHAFACKPCLYKKQQECRNREACPPWPRTTYPCPVCGMSRDMMTRRWFTSDAEAAACCAPDITGQILPITANGGES